MANIYPGETMYGYERGIFRRVSWGALFAGLVVSLVIELVLTLLGLGIGLGSIKPASEQSPFAGVGTGAGIWFGITALVALFLGGWVTAKLAGSVRGLNGVLHSIVMWGLVSLLSFYLMTTAIGLLIGGAGSILGKAVSASALEAKNVMQEQMAQRGISVDTIMNEVRQLSRGGRGAGAGGGEAAGDQDLKQTLERIFSSGEMPVSNAVKQSLINALTARTNMSRADAEKKVDGWIQEYQQAAQSAHLARQRALQTTQQAMQGLSKASIWIFILMVLEAAAAAWGGWLGSSREVTVP